MISRYASGREYRYVVYSSLDSTATLLGTLPDAPAPSFGWGLDGVDGLDLPLARVYGAAGEPAEPGGGILKNGNRVDLYAADAYGDTLIYRGTIEHIDGWRRTAHVVSLARIANQRWIDSASISGDSLTMAFSLFSTYGGSLGWSNTNAPASGVTLAADTLTNVTLAQALGKLADLTGANWHFTITPAGQVRFVDDTNPTTTHILAEGNEVISVNPDRSTLDRAKRVIVQYDDGTTKGTKTATAGDWSDSDPRDLIVQLPQTLSASAAQAYATALLAERDREALSGSCVVAASRYAVDTIGVGDRVRLVIDGTPPGELTGYGETSLRVAHIAYHGDQDTVELTFERPPADLVRQVTTAQAGNAARFQKLYT